MIKDDAETAIANRLGKRTHLKTDSSIENEMDLQQAFLERRAFLPWFLETDFTSFQTGTSTQTLAQPSDFIRFAERQELEVLDPTDGYYYPVPREAIDFLRAENLTEGEGMPKNFEILGTDFYFFPTPDKQYTLRGRYYAADSLPSAITAGQTNNWLTYAPNVLIARTAYIMSVHLQNPTLAEILRQEFMEADFELTKADTANRIAGRDLVTRD